MNKQTLQKLNLLIAATCILIVGIVIGKLQERMQINHENADITLLAQDINPTIPYVKILGLKDGELVGTINNSNIRISTESEIALYDDDLNFTLPFNDILRKNLLIAVPEGMNYVASKRGTKFYNIYDKKATQLSPQNRIFFQTRADALNAGFLEN